MGKKLCLKPDCDLDARAKGHCFKHHMQFKKYGYYLTAEDMRRHRTEAAKKRHSSFKKGHKAWNKGKKNLWTTEHIEAIKKANTGRPAWNRNPDQMITSQDRMERLRFRRVMQRVVFERDDYTCQVCLSRGNQLQVDHIKTWSKHPELRFDLSNCRTLCMPCHYYVTFKRKIPEGIVWGHNLSRRITS